MDCVTWNHQEPGPPQRQHETATTNNNISIIILAGVELTGSVELGGI